MNSIVASVTRRGQVTIPAQLLRRLKLSAPGKVRFVIEDDDSVRIEPFTSMAEKYSGSIPALNPPTTSEFEDEIEDAIDEALAEKYGSATRF